MPDIDTSLGFTTQYYIIESVDSILEVFGNDCIITGLEIDNISINNINESNTLINFSINNGKCIIDKKLVAFPNNILMEINIQDRPNIGRLIVIISYRYLRTSRPNLATVCIKFVDENNLCSTWFEERDKIILGYIDFNKENNFISLNSTNDLTINDKLRSNRKYNNFVNNKINILGKDNINILDLNKIKMKYSLKLYLEIKDMSTNDLNIKEVFLIKENNEMNITNITSGGEIGSLLFENGILTFNSVNLVQIYGSIIYV